MGGAHLRLQMETQGFSRLLTASFATTMVLYSSSTSSSPRTWQRQSLNGMAEVCVGCRAWLQGDYERPVQALFPA